MQDNWVDFKAVKAAVNFPSVLDHYQVNWLRRKGDELRGRCPIHQGEGLSSFHVNSSKMLSIVFLQGARQRFRLRGCDGKMQRAGRGNQTG